MIETVFIIGLALIALALIALAPRRLYRKTDHTKSLRLKGTWVMYDIPNENIYFIDLEYQPTDEDCQKNIIMMPRAQAERIRKAKGLPMPCPPVDVVVSE